MLIDHSHRPWLVFTLIMGAASTGLYLWYAQTWQGGPAGRTWPGMMFGIVGTLLMIFAGLLSARKKTIRLRAGSLALWLKGHIWLGILSVPLIFFHSAFRWGGLVEQILMGVFLLVILSGIVGVVLQNILPQVMKTQLDNEVIPDQLDHLCRVIQQEADDILLASCGKDSVEKALARNSESINRAEPNAWLMAVYLRTIRPFLGSEVIVGSALASKRQGELFFEQALNSVPDELRGAVEQLEELCSMRRRLQLQARMYGLLHSWLKVHIPLSVVLLVFAVLHVATALYY